MDVQCPNCQKKYELNEVHLSKGAVKVRCPQCKHTWIVRKPSAKKNEKLMGRENFDQPERTAGRELAKLPKLLPTEDITKLRMLVGFLGESPQNAWWDTNFLSKTGLQFLEISFPRTAVAAGCVSVSEAAKRLHDDRIGKGGVFHLFRLPSAFEERVHRHLLNTTPGELLAAIESKETALRKLEEFAKSGGTASEGPVHLGDADEILTAHSVSEMATHYLNAFSKGVKTFPYFTERRI